MLVLLTCVLLAGQKPSCCRSMASFADDPAVQAAHLAPAAVTFRPGEGKMVTFQAEGKPGSGFFVPALKGNRTAVLMFHEWWGLNANIKQEAEKLHTELGAAVLAVDLYDGGVATDPQSAGKLMGEMNQARGDALVLGALIAVKKGPLFKARSIGTIGWCFGGGWSQRAAIAGGKNIQACVMYYGMPSTSPADLAHLTAPVLMFWGTQDTFINSRVVSDFSTAMKQAGRPLKTHAFDAPHAFANPSNPKFNKQATKTANLETLAFFRRLLK